MKKVLRVAKNRIWVTFQKEGFHKYPAAGTDPDLADVSFLQYEHRHIFHFRVEIDVNHNERDIEFIQMKRWLESLFDVRFGGQLHANNKSCEAISDDLAHFITQKYPDRDFAITVSEDNENGCYKEYVVEEVI